MNLPVNHPSLLPRLAKSDLYVRFREAFEVASGRTLNLQPVPSESISPFPFAETLRVPVLLNDRPLVFLQMDPVRLSDGKFSTFEACAAQMLDDGCAAEDLRRAQAAFQTMATVPTERYEALRTILQCFSFQLGELAYRLFLQCAENEPPAVSRARHHIMQHLAEPLMLEEVARCAGVSPFHFCKIFKRFTGLTFTEYVNRSRVEKAKHLLLKPQSRVTEVAYDVGFQSLSQFNRSFRRVMAQSPTEFRSQMKPGRPAMLARGSR